jgi:Domain of unknown function (DUF1707)/Domain of unknown function (DUF4190)
MTMPPAARPSDLRASDAEREATVERLRVAAMEGRIDAEELEERLTSAYAARWRSELDALTADVTPPAPAPARSPRPLLVVPARRPTNRLAVLSLASALLFVWFAGIGGAIAAVVLGHVALYGIARSGGAQRGRGWAAAGLVIGYMELLFLVLWTLGRATVGLG